MKKYRAVSPFRFTSAMLMFLLIAIMIYSLARAEATEAPSAEVETVEVVEVVYVEEEVPIEPVEPQKKSLGVFTVTAYCSCEQCCGEWADGYTFTGDKATEGITVATYPDQIPLGTEIEIEGVGTRIAQDIGGSIYENRIDLYMSSHSEALEWGVQELEVWIYE